MAESYFDCAGSSLARGVNLIEASAGTGKTYAIAMLVLRAIAELDVPVEKILVVTFTKAATEELKGRIRGRLLQARDLLEDQQETDDRTMAAWVKNVIDRDSALKRVQLALYDIDRAGIYTIHSFCQRMLQEQALESGQLFDVELLADVASVRNQVVEDFWRKHIYGLPPRIYSVLFKKGYSSPAKLYQSVAGAGCDYDRLEPETGPLSDAIDEFESAFEKMASWWRGGTEQLRDLFFISCEEGKFTKGLRDEVHGWWQSLEDYFAGRIQQLPDNLGCLTRDGLLEKVNGRKIRGKEKQRQFLAGWPLPDEEADAFQAAAKNITLTFRVNLLESLADEVSQRLYSRGVMSFDDLIYRLDDGLREKGGELQRIITERYQVALIDEFQDTDGAQWRIFSSLFGAGSHYMYLIGDPKQAIYKFRGADINSYFSARRSAQNRLTLQKNFRSHPDLVLQVNRLFQTRSNPFGYKEETLPFHPVEAAKTADDGELYHDGRKLDVMTYWQLPLNPSSKNGRWYSGQAGEYFCKQTIIEVLRLLNPKQQAECKAVEGTSARTRPLVPRDIAVLVRSHTHAEMYLQAFAEVGVPAIVSSKQSVFATGECRDLYQLLQAIASPGNALLVKSAMTISWFGLSGNDLQLIWEDEERVEDWFARFQIYSELWEERGFLVMMNRCLEDENVYLTLAEGTMPERRIANIQHLLELVQEAELEEKLGPDQTLLWLKSRLAGEAGSEDVEMRLESDEEAVRIVTMHSAKGLQYPVVFCPYLWYRSSHLKSASDLVRCHDETGRLVADLGSPQFEERKTTALEEELAEELRLLYVAVTRAELKCYIMWADTMGKGSQSALGYLLFGEKNGDFDSQCEVFQNIARKEDVVEYRILMGEGELHNGYRQVLADSNQLSALEKGARSMHTDYQMSSYSAMASLSEQEDHGADHATEAAGGGGGRLILHTGLPAGASFGNLIHDSLELLSFASLAKGEDEEGRVPKLCSRYGIDAEPSAVRDLLATVVNTPLLEAGQAGCFSLSQITDRCCVKEMPFYFQLSHVETGQINKVLRDEPAVVSLTAKAMQGYLTGFVDLVCEYEGRFYILDYKTNYLGDFQHDYCGENLTRAMASHNYGLQYWIYTLVLHRYLQNVKEGYDYARDFGGVMYLFVRGMVPGTAGSGVYYALPEISTLVKLDNILGGKE